MVIKKLFIIMVMSLFLMTVSVSAVDFSIDGCVNPSEEDNTFVAKVFVTNNLDKKVNLDKLVSKVFVYDHKNEEIVKLVDTINHKNTVFEPEQKRTFKKTLTNNKLYKVVLVKNDYRETFELTKKSKICGEKEPVIEVPVEEPVVKKKRNSNKPKIEFKEHEYNTFKTFSVKTKNMNKVFTEDNKVQAYSEKYDKTRWGSTIDKDSFIKGIRYESDNKYTRVNIKYEEDGSVYFDTELKEVELLIYNRWITFDTTKDYKVLP